MKSIKNEADYRIDTFRPEDAHGVGDLFRSVYGEDYPIKLAYSPSALIAAFEKGENIPAVARTSSGKVIGYEALYRSAPNPNLYEAGQGLVTADIRGKGILQRINDYLINVLLPTLDAEGVFGEPVCNHIYSQKTWSSVNTVETAIEVDLMPAETYETEASATGRVAAVLAFRMHRHRKQKIILPACYSSQIESIYANLHEHHDFEMAGNELPVFASNIGIQVFDFAKVARMTVRDIGPDLDAVLSQQEEALKERGIIVFQAWLSLSSPFIGHAVKVLRTHRYFFGGILPGWFGADGLLMQKVMQTPNWKGIHLFSDRAKRILDFVHKDWQNCS